MSYFWSDGRQQTQGKEGYKQSTLRLDLTLTNSMGHVYENEDKFM